jgi:hypothetical protein
MRSCKRIIGYSLLIWAIPFIAALLIFPLRESERALFESIMPVVLTLAVVFSVIKYLRATDVECCTEGLIFGLWAFVICIALDLLLFMWGPMKMSLIDYVKDIGITYLMIPVIAWGIGKFSDRRFEKLKIINQQT